MRLRPCSGIADISAAIAHAVEEISRHGKCDLYLLTGEEIPFVQDGLRDGEHIRQEMHRWFEESPPLSLSLGNYCAVCTKSDFGKLSLQQVHCSIIPHGSQRHTHELFIISRQALGQHDVSGTILEACPDGTAGNITRFHRWRRCIFKAADRNYFCHHFGQSGEFPFQSDSISYSRRGRGPVCATASNANLSVTGCLEFRTTDTRIISPRLPSRRSLPE